MGCDYYIMKVLHIYYDYNKFFSIELERIRQYYIDLKIDSDEDDYEEKINEYYKSTLTPEMKPILIYENNNFIKLSFDTKYRHIIEDELYERGKQWNEIIKIIKVEERSKRY